MTGNTSTRELDIEHLAGLANLPLDEQEQDAMADACQQVLDAFALDEVEGDTEAREPSRLFDDEPEPWPAEDVDAILDQVPRRDGRHIRG